MRHVRSRLGLLSLFVLLVPTAPLFAQQEQQAAVKQSGDATAVDGITKGRLEGEVAAQRVGTGGWFVGGFASGLVLGLIGTAVIYVAAGNSDTAVPPDRRLVIANQPSHYQQAFEVGYGEKIKSKRKGAALGGGLLGTATIVLLIVSASSGDQ